VGNLAWALDEMADSTLRRSHYRIRTALNIALPALLLVFGVLVAGFAAGMLLPLVNMIQVLT
jgi:type II secretory pathway component PulF